VFIRRNSFFLRKSAPRKFAALTTLPLFLLCSAAAQKVCQNERDALTSCATELVEEDAAVVCEEVPDLDLVEKDFSEELIAFDECSSNSAENGEFPICTGRKELWTVCVLLYPFTCVLECFGMIGGYLATLVNSFTTGIVLVSGAAPIVKSRTKPIKIVPKVVVLY
jgi:hypothetical protein